jgi:hypothetical protein
VKYLPCNGTVASVVPYVLVDGRPHFIVQHKELHGIIHKGHELLQSEWLDEQAVPHERASVGILPNMVLRIVEPTQQHRPDHSEFATMSIYCL